MARRASPRGKAGVCALLAACGTPAALPPASAPASRIVSLDYCADQFVLKLAGPDRILALSPDADAAFSYLKDQAGGLPQVRPVAEDVLALEPDLIVRTYGGGPQAAVLFARAGVPVLQVGYAGSLEDIFAVTETVAEGLGVPEAGAALNAETHARIAAVAARAGQPETLYMTPGGVTAGTGTLIDDLFARAGLSNFETRAGWHALPLERLAMDQPDRVAAAFYATAGLAGDAWSSARHPLAKRQVETLPTTRLEGAWTACGAWFLVDAIEALAAGDDTP